MPYRRITITAIVLLFFGVILWTFTYGPAKRSFVMPEKIATVRSLSDINDLWHSSGVRGRIAVIFAQHLNLLSLGSSYPDGSYLDTAMRRGIVRKAYYIVPDRLWAQIATIKKMEGALMAPPQITDQGFYLLHEGGRIYTMPLSNVTPIREKALVVIDPAAWSTEERSRIDHLFKIGFLFTDLIAVADSELKPSKQDIPWQKELHH